MPRTFEVYRITSRENGLSLSCGPPGVGAGENQLNEASRDRLGVFPCLVTNIIITDRDLVEITSDRDGIEDGEHGYRERASRDPNGNRYSTNLALLVCVK